jgi:membrane complex biogenesis BtpA family protein
MTPSVLPPKPNVLTELFSVPKPIIGVIHLDPLPGSPRYEGKPVSAILKAAADDARRLADGGVDGIIVENAFDLPFARPEDIGQETVACLTAACFEVRNRVSLPIGVTCVANGVLPALAVAKATGARWIRANQWVNAYVANEGVIDGPAGKALRYRARIYARDVRIFADVHVKFGSHAITADRSLAEQATDAEFFDADALIATGNRTSDPTDPEEVAGIRAGTSLPVLIGSGLDAQNAETLLRLADGAIVGSWLKREGAWWKPVDPSRVSRLMAVVRKVREATAQPDGRVHRRAPARRHSTVIEDKNRAP